MFKNFYKFNIRNLIKIRLHLGHKDSNLNSKLTSYIYGSRHNINIYNLDKLWKPYRYLFHSLTLNFYKRNSFFIVGTNPNLPMSSILEKLLNQYPFLNKKNLSFYISGYIDRKWIGGLFSNWKIFVEFLQYLENPYQKLTKNFKYQKYFWYLKGVRFLEKNPVPDFAIFLDKNDLALKEMAELNIPLIGLVDTDMDPKNYLYKFFGNNDSLESIKFFFDFLKEALKEGRLKEQHHFFLYFLKKIQNSFKQISQNQKQRWLKKQALLKAKKNKKLVFTSIKNLKLKKPNN